MRNTGLEAQAGIKIARRNINNLRYADDTTLMAERGTKEPLCWGPAPADPGSSKRGRRQRGSGYNSFN